MTAVRHHSLPGAAERVSRGSDLGQSHPSRVMQALTFLRPERNRARETLVGWRRGHLRRPRTRRIADPDDRRLPRAGRAVPRHHATARGCRRAARLHRGIAEPFAGEFDVVAGVEARGFLLAGAIAIAAGVGLVPIRKAGKLPRPAASVSYSLEYGTATIEAHDDIRDGARVLLVDDVLATGGTLRAAQELIADARRDRGGHGGADGARRPRRPGGRRGRAHALPRLTRRSAAGCRR